MHIIAEVKMEALWQESRGIIHTRSGRGVKIGLVSSGVFVARSWRIRSFTCEANTATLAHIISRLGCALAGAAFSANHDMFLVSLLLSLNPEAESA